MYYADLGTRCQIASGPHVRAVGWLSATVDYTRGDVSPEFREKLQVLCAAWGLGLEQLWWPAAGGFHECEFCSVFRSSGNIGVPAGDVLFAAPKMIFHYVDVHAYQPPAPFIEAVLKSPVPGTTEYGQMVAPFAQMHQRSWSAG